MCRFRREERLKGRNDISEVFKKGKRVSGKGAKLFVLKNNLSYNRICFTFVRGFGNAVERNRAKRLGREAYRTLKPRLQGGYNLILLVYPEDAVSAGRAAKSHATLEGRMGQLRYLCAKAGLLT